MTMWRRGPAPRRPGRSSDVCTGHEGAVHPWGQAARLVLTGEAEGWMEKSQAVCWGGGRGAARQHLRSHSHLGTVCGAEAGGEPRGGRAHPSRVAPATVCMGGGLSKEERAASQVSRPQLPWGRGAHRPHLAMCSGCSG